MAKDKKYLDNAEATLDRIIGFINNCDQKASILLALIGGFISFFLTSDYSRYIKDHLLNPIISHTFDVKHIVIVRYFSIAVGLALSITLCLSVMYLIKTIEPNRQKKNDKKKNKRTGKEDEVIEESNIYFDDIAKYETFKKFTNSTPNYDNDISNQIWQNGLVCKRKFDLFSNAIQWFKYSCIFLIIFILTLLFI